MTIHGIRHIYPGAVFFPPNHIVLSRHIYGGKAISMRMAHLLLGEQKCKKLLF